LGVKDPVLYNNRGKAYLEQESYNEAIADFSQAIRLNAQYAKAFENRGLAYFKMEKYAEAAKDLRTAEKLIEKPEASLYKLLADSYFNAKNYVVSLEYFDKLIKAGFNDKEVYYRRGRVLMETESYEVTTHCNCIWIRQRLM
jgi:tetratricopeptide (TPR) repeat protein